MSDQPPSEVLGALPRRRPQRRSDKRASPAQADERKSAAPERKPAAPERKPAAPEGQSATPRATPGGRPERLRQPAQPPGVPTMPRRRPIESSGRHMLGTAAQAAAELAEIGLAVGTRALRNAIGRLPRP